MSASDLIAALTPLTEAVAPAWTPEAGRDPPPLTDARRKENREAFLRVARQKENRPETRDAVPFQGNRGVPRAPENDGPDPSRRPTTGPRYNYLKEPDRPLVGREEAVSAGPGFCTFCCQCCQDQTRGSEPIGQQMFDRMSDQVLDQMTDQRSSDRATNRAARRFNSAVLAVLCLFLGGFAVLAIFYLVCWGHDNGDTQHVWPVCAKLGFNITKPNRGDGSGSEGSGHEYP